MENQWDKSYDSLVTRQEFLGPRQGGESRGAQPPPQAESTGSSEEVKAARIHWHKSKRRQLQKAAEGTWSL